MLTRLQMFGHFRCSAAFPWSLSTWDTCWSGALCRWRATLQSFTAFSSRGEWVTSSPELLIRKKISHMKNWFELTGILILFCELWFLVFCDCWIVFCYMLLWCLTSMLFVFCHVCWSLLWSDTCWWQMLTSFLVFWPFQRVWVDGSERQLGRCPRLSADPWRFLWPDLWPRLRLRLQPPSQGAVWLPNVGLDRNQLAVQPQRQ